MKVEATWRGAGRLEILCTGVQPAEADGLLESIGVAATPEDTEPLPGPVGWSQGFTGGVFLGPVYHRWSGRYLSDCGRWRADRATGDFRPFLEGEKACWECEAAA